MKKFLLIAFIALGLFSSGSVLAQSVAGSSDSAYAAGRSSSDLSSMNRAEDDIMLYPNPAGNNINVIYSPNAGIKNISIYNIIGKVLTVYKVTGNNANLDISNIPSGIYFIRLLDANGNTVATRKFTRQ